MMAANEIQEILKKYDIAGVVLLHTPGFIQYELRLDPAYSCVEFATNRFKIHPPAPDLSDEKKDKKMISETVNMLANMRHKLGQLTMAMQQAEFAVRQEFQIKPPPTPGNGAPIILKP